MRETQDSHQSKNGTSGTSRNEGRIWELWLFAILFVLIFSAIARAEVGGNLLVETTRTLRQEGEADSYGGWYRLTLGTTHRPTQITASTVWGYSREYSYERDDGTDGSFDNPVFALSRSFKAGTDFSSTAIDSVSLGIRGSLPANREARQQTLLGTFGPSVAVSKKISRVSLNQEFGYSRRFYEYDIRDDGTVNSPDSFRSTSGVELAVTDAFSLASSLAYTYAISFQGVGRASSLFATSVNYAVMEKASLSVGFGTEKGTLEADGQTNRIKFFDPDSSQAFVDFVISI